MTLKANRHLTDAEVEKIMATHTSDRVHVEDIEQRIASIAYQVLDGTTVTICSITLDNGFSVRGESACVDPANFNTAIGEKYAYENAFEKLWPFLGFLLAEKRHIRNKAQRT